MAQPHQVDGVDKSVFVLVVGQYLPEVRDVAGRQAQRVQLGELGVRRHPGQGGLQPGEGFGQHPHPGSLAGVGRVPLHVLALRLRHALRGAFPRRRLASLPRCVARALAVGALPRAFVGVFAGGAELEDAVQELVVDVAEGAGGHGTLFPTGARSKHGSGTRTGRTDRRRGDACMDRCA